MDYKEFRELVRKLRHAQRLYFRYRTSKELSEAKRLERLLDSELAKDSPAAYNGQLSLFDGKKEG